MVVCVDDVLATVDYMWALAKEWNIGTLRIGSSSSPAEASAPCTALIVERTGNNTLGIRGVCASYPQMPRDPLEVRDWIPKTTYGNHAFG